MKRKIVYYLLFIFLLVLTSYSTTTFSKYTQDINKKLTLNVSQPQYTISFNKNSSTATGSTESVSCVYGTTCNLTTNGFSNNGYTFGGWNTKSDGTGDSYTTSALNLTAINNNTVTLYAMWIPINYNITYELRGGSISTANPTTYNPDTPTFTLNNPTRSGYSFDGWTGSNGNTPQTNVSITKGSIGDKSYTANWYKNASSLTITLSESTYTYDGNAKTPSVTVKDGSTTLVQGVDYEVSYSNNTNAGTATVTITMKNNYNSTTQATYKNSTTKNFTINKKTVTVTAGNKTMTYGDNAPSYTNTITGVINGETAYTGSVSYTVKNNSNTTVTINKTTPVGTYSINPGGLTATNNYQITYVPGTLTINNATPTVNVTAKNNLVYNGSAQSANSANVTLVNGEIYIGSITYTYYSDSTCTTKVTTSNSGASSTGGTPVNAGNWYVIASINSFGNYNGGSSSCVAHTIAKATPIISVSENNIELTGYYSTTFIETANVTGTFTNTSQNTGVVTVSPVTSSEDESLEVVTVYRNGAGQSEIIVTFTPTDTTNYNTITASSNAKKVVTVNFPNLVKISINKDSNPWDEHSVSNVRISRTTDNWYTDLDFNGVYFRNVYGIPQGTYNLIADGVSTGDSFTITENNGVTNDVYTGVNYYTLTINPGTCSQVTGGGVYLGNQTASITATPAQGYHFTYWSSSDLSGNTPASTTSESTTISTSRTTNLVANCELNPYYNVTFLYNGTDYKEFSYVGNYEDITINIPAKYKFEAWGAQGGNSVNDGSVSSNHPGGKGAYTSGIIEFKYQPLPLITVEVGSKPSSISGGKKDNPGGYNGGGIGRWDKDDNDSSSAGGGATDFRFYDYNSYVYGGDHDNWADPTNLRYRVMVAAGGSGNSWSSIVGHGGTLESVPASTVPVATQTSAGRNGTFGKGGAGNNSTTKVGNAGGGGGYWGGSGGAGNASTPGYGTGGSSYISGHTGTVAVISNSSNSPRYASDGTTVCANGTTDNTCSIHFTGYTFTDTVMIAGNEEMPTWDGTSTMIGNSGHGHAKVSTYSFEKPIRQGTQFGTVPTNFGIAQGYEINWVDENDNPVYEDTIFTADHDIVIHADGLRPINYTITYNLDGGTNHEDNVDSFTYNNSLVGLNIRNASKPGYEFLGWTGSNGNDPKRNYHQHTLNSNLEFTANWFLKEDCITITQRSYNRFIYDQCDDSTERQFIVNTHAEPPSIDDSRWKTYAEIPSHEVSINQSESTKTAYIWTKLNGTIAVKAVDTYMVYGTGVSVKYIDSSGVEISGRYVLENTPVYLQTTGYSTQMVSNYTSFNYISQWITAPGAYTYIINSDTSFTQY